MAVTPRDYSITWGSLVVPGAVGNSRVELYRVHEIDDGPRGFRLRFSCVLHSPTEADFRADTGTFQSLARSIRNTVRVSLPGGAVFALTHTGNTILNGSADWSKPGSPVDTARSRLYEVTIRGDRPALGTNALDPSFTWRLTDLPSQETLTVTGEYTASGGTQARAQYLANIAARVSTITTALGGTWELTSDVHDPDDADQTVQFVRTYRRLTFNQSSGTLDDPALVGQVLSVNRRRLTVGGLEGSPLMELTLLYRTEVERTQVDSGGVVQAASVLSLWENTVRPHLLAQLDALAGGQSVAVVDEDPGLSLDPPGFQVRMVALAQDSGGTLLRKTVTTEDFVDSGAILTRIWPEGDVDRGRQEPTRAHDNQGPRVIRRRITQIRTFVGSPANVSLGNGRDEIADPPPAGGRLVQIDWGIRFAERVEGLQDGTQIQVTDEVRTATWELIARRGVGARVGG